MIAMEKRLTDFLLIFSALALLSIGLLELYAISVVGGEDYFVRQALFAGVSFAAAAAVYFLGRRNLFRLARPIYYGAILLLVAVLVFGREVRGTVGWLSFGSWQLQAVEPVKVALIIFLAAFVSAKRTVFSSGGRLLISFILTSVPTALVLAQPDLGSAIILLAIWFGTLFLSGIRKSHLWALVILLTLTATAGWFSLADYQKNRVLTFLDPYSDARGSGYNVIQSMTAVGSGGLGGLGPGRGTQTQLNFLPEKHTDFIFAAIAEELGAIGAWLVIALYAVMLGCMYRIAARAEDNFSYLLVSGVMIMFFAQVMINIGMNIGLMPVTGIPLPLISYGGSSLLSAAAALALVLSVSRSSRFASRSVSEAEG